MDAVGEAGPYRLLAELGRDDTGRVFVARGPDGELYAVKLVHDRLVSDEFRARLREEIATPRRFAGLEPVMAGDADAAVPWVAARAPEGVPVAAATPMHDRDMRWLVTGVASTLKRMHHNELAHGELSAATVWLTRNGTAVIDFGIARAAHEQSPPDDIRALGALVEFAVTGATSGRRNKLPKRLRSLVASCRDAAPGAHPTAGELVKKIDIEDYQRTWQSEVTDLLTARVTEWVGRLGSKPQVRYPLWDPEAERAKRKRKMAARRAAARAAIVRRDAARAADRDANRPAAAPATPVVAAAPASRLSRADRALVAAIAVFVGWVAGQLVLGWATVSGRPSHADLLAHGGLLARNAFPAYLAWLTSGFVVGVIAAVVLWLVVEQASARSLWLLVGAVSACPLVLWAGVVVAGVDLEVVTIGSRDLSGFGELFAIVLGIPLFFVLDRVYPRRRRLARLGGFLFWSLAFATVPICLDFGWMGVVLADIVQVNVVTVLAGTFAGAFAYRKLRSARSRTAAPGSAPMSG